jgi:ABC-type glycerol-3-phosphate transport system permease component
MNRRNFIQDLSDYGFIGLSYSYLLIIALSIIIPFLFVISISVRPPEGLFGEPHLIPKEISLQGWRLAYNDVKGPIWNSILIATGTTIIALCVTIPGAYAFARKDFPGKTLAFYLIVSAVLFPYLLLIVPITDLWFRLGLYNTIPGLWLAYQVFVAPFAIWILRDFFEDLPVHLEEAARVYGCTQFQAFIRVILPLSIPAIIAIAFLAFLIGWNDFLFSNMLTDGSGPRPAVVSLYMITQGERTFWGWLMAESLIIGTPPAVLYIIGRRSIQDAFAT